jgi:hypothetical protein
MPGERAWGRSAAFCGQPARDSPVLQFCKEYFRLLGMATVITDTQARSNIAENIRRILTARGWSQARLAKATNESEMRISLVVRGVHEPGAAFLARIAEALNTTSDDLLSQPS